MNRSSSLEVAVGVFVVVGVLCLGWLSLRLGRVELPGQGGYPVRAVFNATGGLAPGASVEIAGVRVGQVERVGLREWRAVVVLRLDKHVQLPDDSIASIKTKGLIGDHYVAITPGASSEAVAAGGTLRDTEDAVDFEQLLSQFIHGKM